METKLIPILGCKHIHISIGMHILTLALPILLKTRLLYHAAMEAVGIQVNTDKLLHFAELLKVGSLLTYLCCYLFVLSA